MFVPKIACLTRKVGSLGCRRADVQRKLSQSFLRKMPRREVLTGNAGTSVRVAQGCRTQLEHSHAVTLVSHKQKIKRDLGWTPAVFASRSVCNFVEDSGTSCLVSIPTDAEKFLFFFLKLRCTEASGGL